MPAGGEPAEIGVLGGTGLYRMLADGQPVTVDTPYGPPSPGLTVGTLGGRRVAFLPRHGDRHQHAPHRVNYRANLWALRALGVRQVLAAFAVGSLRPELTPGAFVVLDQVVDRTWGRPGTLYDDDGAVVHVPFAEPYCPRGRAVAVAAARASGLPCAERGTLVVINGPRFSSTAESVWHAAQGWDVVGMTGQPEAAVARELALCYTGVAVVTDHDAGVAGSGAVTQDEVLRVFAANLDRLRDLLATAPADLPPTEDDAQAGCPCRRSLDGLTLPFPLP